MSKSKDNILLICHDIDRGDTKNNLPYSKLIDSLHEEFENKGFQCYQVARPGSVFVKEKAWVRPNAFEEYFRAGDLIKLIEKKIHRLVRYTFGVKWKPKFFFVIRRYFEKWLYIFKKINPKAIFVIDASSEMCTAARELDIPLIEVLHGIGYVRLPWDWNSRTVNELPTHVLCLDSISYKNLSELSAKGIVLKEIPHPWYKRFSSGNKDHGLDPTWTSKPYFIPEGMKMILISLTWGYDGDHGEYPEFANIIPSGLFPEELVEVIDQTCNEVFYCIRRHPLQLMQDQYSRQIHFLDEFVGRRKNCEFIKSSKATLISLLGHANGHITMISMTSFDAALMGVKTLFLCPTLLPQGKNSLMFEDLVDAGYARKAVIDTSEILNWVRNVKKHQPYQLSYATNEEWDLFIDEIIKNDSE